MYGLIHMPSWEDCVLPQEHHCFLSIPSKESIKKFDQRIQFYFNLYILDTKVLPDLTQVFINLFIFLSTEKIIKKKKPQIKLSLYMPIGFQIAVPVVLVLRTHFFEEMKAKLLFMLIYLLPSINYFWYGTLSLCKIEDLQYH